MREGVLEYVIHTLALTNKLEFHALNVSRLCKFVVVNQMLKQGYIGDI